LAYWHSKAFKPCKAADTENNLRSQCIELKDKQTHRVKAILSNADTHKTFLELIGREHLPADFAQSIESLKPSPTAFIVFLGLEIVPNLSSITMDDIWIIIPSNIDRLWLHSDMLLLPC
jgi:hypothetical protein